LLVINNPRKLKPACANDSKIWSARTKKKKNANDIYILSELHILIRTDDYISSIASVGHHALHRPHPSHFFGSVTALFATI